MSFWFITGGQVKERAGEYALAFPSEGLPDLSKALSQAHLREWVKHLHPESAPETVDQKAEYYWKLYSSLAQDDFVVALKEGDVLALGEITRPYRYEQGSHYWPVKWLATDIPLASQPSLRHWVTTGAVREIKDSEARVLFRKYIQSWQTKGYVVFRWVLIVLLVSELVYFWPKN